jgi:S1-C subfamily serine protease
VKLVVSPVLVALLSLSSPAGQTSKSNTVLAQEPSLADQIDGVRTSVVAVVVAAQRDTPQEKIPEKYRSGYNPEHRNLVVGTGFIVNAKGDVVTALHVVDAARSVLADWVAAGVVTRIEANLQGPNVASIHLKMRDTWSVWPVTVAGENADHDIAVLSPFGDSFKIASVPMVTFDGKNPVGGKWSTVAFDTSQPREGTDVFVCGYPIGSIALTTTSGHVAGAWEQRVLVTTRKHNLPTLTDVYQLDLLATFGNSGGPAFLRSNSALTAMILEPSADLGVPRIVVVPSKYITEFLDKLNVTWSHPVLK